MAIPRCVSVLPATLTDDWRLVGSACWCVGCESLDRLLTLAHSLVEVGNVRGHLAHGIGQLSDYWVFSRLIPIDLQWSDHGFHWVQRDVGDSFAQAFGERLLECIDHGVPGRPISVCIVDFLCQVEVHG